MGILDFFFPKKCAGCGRVGTYFCAACIQNSKLFFPQTCPVCKRASLDGVTHKYCQRGFAPNGLTSVWVYTGAPKSLVLKLKYKYVTELVLSLAVPAAGILKETKRSMPEAPNWKSKLVLVPIPLHWTRRNWRGFNHTEEVGKILAQMMGWEMVSLLERSAIKRSQVGLKGKERRKNVVGVFKLGSNIAVQQDSNIVLFDDVWTTGATMREAAKVLKKAGFKKVWCLTLAR